MIDWRPSVCFSTCERTQRLNNTTIMQARRHNVLPTHVGDRHLEPNVWRQATFRYASRKDFEGTNLHRFVTCSPRKDARL